MSLLVESRAALSVRDLTFSYHHVCGGHSRDDKGWAIRGLSFRVREGEVLGIIGPNGSGKTSLVKLLAKVVRPHAGSIDLFGVAIDGMAQDAVARRVALVPQETAQLFPFTIAELVLMGRFPHHSAGWRFGGMEWETPEEIGLAERVMSDLHVRHLADRLLHEVSGGERQRAVIARALVQEPDVLLLDEPTAFLDLHHQMEIIAILRRLNAQRGLTVVMVSHDLNLASQACDRLLLLRHGEMVALGTPDEVIRPELIREVYDCEVLVDRHPVSGRPRVTL
ncbi:MAG: ABC transporter ATP-binding protein [Nitrospirae bacterium]|nr:ABC transporter ATP-binding protein [Nitrospirota bacterium]